MKIGYYTWMVSRDAVPGVQLRHSFKGRLAQEACDGCVVNPVVIQLATDMAWYLMVSRKPWKSSKDSARRGGTARSFLHSRASETKTNSTCMFSLWEN